MRIAYVITRADAVGGATVHVRDLARAMQARGHEAMVFLGGTGPVTEQLAGAGVPFRPLAFLQRAIHPWCDWRGLWELRAALWDFRPDLVSTHTAKAGWIGRAACALLGLPAVYTPHGWAVGDRVAARHAALFRLAEKAAARWARAIICVCEYERQLALAHRIAGSELLRVVHNGVQDLRTGPASAPPPGPLRIVSVARFEAPKDHHTLLLACERLRALDWELDLVGDGPLEAATRTLAATLGIAGRVHFLGYRPDVAELLAGAQIFVLSSRSEAFPRSVLEAMRAGLPVVASDVGGVAEAVDNGVSGLLVPRNDAAALAEALRGLIVDDFQRHRMGAAARRKYEMCFRLEQMVEATAAVYESVLHCHARNGAPA